MSKKIAINGIEVIVNENDVYKLIDKLEGVGMHVDDLESWMSTDTHEQYDFEKFIEKANEYSQKSPPDVVQFSEKSWGAASLCIKEFYLKRFGLYITSLRKELLDPPHCCRTRSRTQACLDRNMVLHSNFYEMKFIPADERHDILESIKEMPKVVQFAKLEVVEAELDNMKTVKLRNVRKRTCKIGNNSYDYTRVAY